MFFSTLLAASAAFLSLTDFAAAAPKAARGIACNNSPDLCNKNYNDITYLGAHDSAFLRDSSTGFSVSGNQFYNATIALSAGLRFLQAQVHNFNGTLELCHTSCSLLDAGSLESLLSQVKAWMDTNPNEVVTLLLVNSDNNSTESFGAAFDASGIGKYGYTPPSVSASARWPTLQTLISANTRLVTFLTNSSPSTTYPYLLPEFSYVFENEFSVTSLNNFSCDLSRPSSLSSATSAISAGYMPLLNHFADVTEAFGIQVPDINDITTTNSASPNVTGSLGSEVNKCQSEWGIKPTFVLVDFWNVEGPIAVIDGLNGITPTGRSLVSQNVLTASTSGVGSLEGLSGWRVAAVLLVTVAGMNIFCL